MSDQPVIHSTFALQRSYPAAPARVFAAWAEPEAKAKWFAGPNAEHRLDFRVGGREVATGANSEGDELTFESTYHDIVPDARIVYSSTLSASGRRPRARIHPLRPRHRPGVGHNTQPSRAVPRREPSLIGGMTAQ